MEGLLSDVLPPSIHTKLGPIVPNVFIPASALLAIAFAILLWARVSRVKVAGAGGQSGENGRQYLLEEEQRGEDEVRILQHIPACCSLLPSRCKWQPVWLLAGLQSGGHNWLLAL